MTEPEKKEDILGDEFRNLGKNLADVLRTVWESPERKNMQQEIESGLTEMGRSLNQEIDSFRQSPTGQRLKSDMEDLDQRIRSGEVTTKARDELLSALKRANAELQKVIARWEKTEKTEADAGGEPNSSAPSEPPKEA